jgi:uncharacterized damage-inducible protein DinB
MTHYSAKTMADAFRTVRKNTVQVAEDIPEDKYSYRAAPGTMSVAEMLAHLAANTDWARIVHTVDRKDFVSFEDFGTYMGEGQKFAETLKTKADIVAALKSKGESFAAAIEGMSDAQLGEHVRFPPPLDPPSKPRFEMLLGVKEHEMHHRGQLMLIERMLGIVPHLTRRRQEAQAARATA